MEVVLSKHTFCCYCLRLTLAPIPCEGCAVMYCSEECRLEASKKYHKTECGIPTDLELFSMLQVLMTITNQGASLKELKESIEEISKCEDRRKTGFTGDQFIGNSMKALLSINYNENDVSGTDIYQVARLAVVLRNYTNFLRGSNDVLSLAKIMLQLHYIVNKYGQLLKCDKLNDGQYFKGLYPVFNLLNHSCVSNTLMYILEDKRRVLRASRDIKSGEQIFICYLNSVALSCMNASTREEMISEMYGFMCRCEACNNNYTFNMEVTKKLKLPARLQRRLRKAPINIESMWELLGILQREIQQPCLEVELMKFALSCAYVNEEYTYLRWLYTRLGVF